MRIFKQFPIWWFPRSCFLAISILCVGCGPHVISSHPENHVQVDGGASTVLTRLPSSPSNRSSPSSPVRYRPSQINYTSDAIVTFYEKESGDIKKVIKVRGGDPVEVSGLADGTYLMTTEFRNNRLKPPPSQEVVVLQGIFNSVESRAQAATSTGFYYKWVGEDTRTESEYSLNDEPFNRVTILDQPVKVYNSSSARTLLDKYNIALSDEGLPWGNDTAAKILKMVDLIPHNKLSKTATFVLIASTNSSSGIEVTRDRGHAKVKISLPLFEYADERLVKLDGKKGKFFSYKLMKSLVYFFTNNGNDLAAVNKILNDKFGVTTTIPNYQTLTSEHAGNFQGFHASELIALIHSFYNMPTGYHKIPGLRYLVRRKNGHTHPLYPTAAAVAWPRGKDTDSYIEFMEKAFIGGAEYSTHRLILHEKSHFMWSNLFSDEIKNKWIEIGEWFKNPKVSSGWSTRGNVNFVSAYSHDKNPNEDMAESLSYYVLNPKKLKSLAPTKFRFIESKIMNGYRYVAKIASQFTFQVLNLFPDYYFPGKIVGVEIRADGNQHEDKRVTITIDLADKEGIKDDARYAYLRIFSPIDTYVDLYLYPVNGNGHKLRGTITIPGSAKRGYWKVENISIYDSVGNARHEGVIDFGWKLYINNSLEDTTPPVYVPNSLTINATERRDSANRQIYDVTVKWDVNESSNVIRNPGANLIYLGSRDVYGTHKYGTYDPTTRKVTVTFQIPQYYAKGAYGISYLHMKDGALNSTRQYFSDDPKHEPITQVTLNTEDPDYGKPTLDVPSITVQASPVNPVAPDGSTNVVIRARAKDDKSGIWGIFYLIVDPTGKEFSGSFNNSNAYTTFYVGNPVLYKYYESRFTLPKGSAPGTWGIREMTLEDKAHNYSTYNFTEIVHFRVDD